MEKKITNKEYISSYITGLFETIGHIEILKNNKYPKLTLTFNEKNKEYLPPVGNSRTRESVELAEVIRERIGHGAIYEQEKRYRYRIFNKEGILKFIELTSKYYRTPKINKFNEMIEYINKNKGYNYKLAEIDKSSFESNAWLSGYLEASGGFRILIKSKNTQFRYSNNFELQLKKDEEKTNEPLMLALATFLKVSLKEKKTFNKKNFCIKIDSIEGTKQIINYLLKYPLYGKKYLDFQDYYYIYRIHTNYKFAMSEGQTLENYEEFIINIKNKMNRKRTNFDIKEQIKNFPKLPLEEWRISPSEKLEEEEDKKD